MSEMHTPYFLRLPHMDPLCRCAHCFIHCSRDYMAAKAMTSKSPNCFALTVQKCYSWCLACRKSNMQEGNVGLVQCEVWLWQLHGTMAWKKTYGWRMEMPSLSTVFSPSDRMLSNKLAMPSSRRLISSTYKMPLWAWANSPGWNTVLPSCTFESHIHCFVLMWCLLPCTL